MAFFDFDFDFEFEFEVDSEAYQRSVVHFYRTYAIFQPSL